MGIGLFARSWGSLVPFLALAGILSTIAVPASDLWIPRAVPPHRHGLAFGVMSASRSGAALLAGIAVPLVATTIGWRWAFVVAGLIASTTLLAVPRGRSEGRGRRQATRGDDITIRPLIVLAVGFGFGAAGAASLLAFAVTTAVQAGMSEAAAGWLFGFGAVVGITCRLLFGYLSDLRSRGHLRGVGVLFLVGSFAYLLLATNDTMAIFVGMPLAFGTAWGWTGIFTFSVVGANPNAPAAATSITRTGGFVGGVVGPLVFGFLAQQSYPLAWTVVAGWALVAAAVILLGRRLVVREVRHRERNESSQGRDSKVRRDQISDTVGDEPT